jgi:hypothetical protein
VFLFWNVVDTLMVDWPHSYDDARWRTLESNVCILDSHLELLRAHHPETSQTIGQHLAYSMAVRLAASEAYFVTMGRIMERNDAQASLWSAMQSARRPLPRRWRQLEDSWHGNESLVGLVKYRHNVIAHANHEVSATTLSAQLPRTTLQDLCNVVDDVCFCFSWIARDLTEHNWPVSRHFGHVVEIWRQLQETSASSE